MIFFLFQFYGCVELKLKNIVLNLVRCRGAIRKLVVNINKL